MTAVREVTLSCNGAGCAETFGAGEGCTTAPRRDRARNSTRIGRAGGSSDYCATHTSERRTRMFLNRLGPKAAHRTKGYTLSARERAGLMGYA